MAFGQKFKTVAGRQPGTSNLPYPIRVRTSGGFLGLFPRYKILPRFNPVKVTLAENNADAVVDLALVIGLQFKAINSQIGTTGVPDTVLNSLAEINSNLTRIADQKAAILNGLNDLNAAIGTKAVAINQETAILTTKVASQIQFDNFFKAYNGEKPTLPSFEELIKKAIKEGIQLNDQATKSGYITNRINSIVSNVKTWIAGTAVYQGIKNFLDKIKNVILSVLPSSLRSKASNINTGSPNDI